jgi:hypothetical protein
LNFRLIEMLLARLYRAARWLFGLRVEVVPASKSGRKPMRAPCPGPSSSCSGTPGPGDTFLLLYGLLANAGRRSLLALKHTLALDPRIEVPLGRVPHSFIDPGGHGDQAVALISDLVAGLETGTRWSSSLKAVTHPWPPPPRHRRPAAPGPAPRGRQAAPDRPCAAAAPVRHFERYRCPPHADLVIVAHTGLDHLDSTAAVWQGIPLQRRLQVTWWRIPAGDVPSGKDASTEWLNGQWMRVDDWIDRYAASSRSKNER